MVVVGDAETYDLLQYQYGESMGWLIPFPGDWHILLNYQKAIMRPYADAGLANLAELSGYRSETLTSLIQCTNFRRTHNFLLQAFEAFYLYFIQLYLTQKHDSEPNYKEQVEKVIKGLAQSFDSIDNNDQLHQFQSKVSCQLELISLRDFMEFMDDFTVLMSSNKLMSAKPYITDV